MKCLLFLSPKSHGGFIFLIISYSGRNFFSESEMKSSFHFAQYLCLYPYVRASKHVLLPAGAKKLIFQPCQGKPKGPERGGRKSESVCTVLHFACARACVSKKIWLADKLNVLICTKLASSFHLENAFILFLGGGVPLTSIYTCGK